jgi:hypothetical protein
MQKQRRNFLKMTAAGAAGLALVRADKAHAAWPSTGTMPVNPNISNMRVVSCVDTQMVPTAPTTMTFAAENAAVNTCRVQANMDAMAMQLSNAATADAAWKTIFTSSKPWASTLVAIKVNGIEPKNMARIAVLQKFCSVLANLGVQPANIIVYDGSSLGSGGMSNYTSYFSLTDTSKIQAVVTNSFSTLGGTTSAKLPDGSSANCVADIANGKVDILINVANNKGHSMFGGSTLCMKNHFGTFDPNHTNLASYVFNINKSDAIVGGTPVRQQLCFIDSLFANKASNTGTPEVMPCYLIMGVFGPAVDYLTVKNVREAVMGCTHDAATVNSFMTSFGYATTDPQWVVVAPAAAACGSDAGTSGTGGSSGSGGNSGARDAGRDGTSGTGGAGNGGTPGTGGAGSGGANSSGGSGSGGVNASGGAVSGGANGSGGASGGGGVSGSGSTGSGGATAKGGSTGSGGTSSSSSGLGGTGGATAGAAGGATGTGGTGAGASSGCGCDLGRIPGGGGRLGLMLASGALVAGMLQRLAVRKESRAQSAKSPDEEGASKTDPEKDASDVPRP